MSIHRIGFGFLLLSATALSLLTPSNHALGQGKADRSQKTAVVCTRDRADRAKEADAKIARQIRISVQKPDRLNHLGSFQVEIEFPQLTNVATQGIGVIVGISENATIESSDDVLVTPRGQSIGYALTTDTLKEMQRASVQFSSQTPDGPKTTWDKSTIRFSVRVWGGDSVRISWVTTGGFTTRGSMAECPAQDLTEIMHSSIPVFPAPIEQSISALTCSEEERVLRELAGHVTVTLSAPNAPRVGQAISVLWSQAETRFPNSRPTYIVFSLPDDVRFEGKNLIALPKKTRAPASITFEGDHLRAFVPLHAIGSPVQGELKIKPTKSGYLRGEYAIVTKTKCGELVLLRQEMEPIFINGGPPEVVVQNFFEVESPKRVVHSNDGRYRLDVFPQSFRVYELATGTKIVDGVGRNPNFSPGSRFVAALVGSEDEDTGGKMSLYDLNAQRLVDFKLAGPILGWAHNDGILIEGTYPRGELKIRQSLIDPVPPSVSHAVKDAADNSDQENEIGLVIPSESAAGRSSSAWEALRFRIEIEHGIAVLVDNSNMLRTRIWELATGYIVTVAPDQSAFVLSHFGLKDLRTPSFWDPGEQLKLSHYSPEVDRILSGLTEQRNFPKQKSFLVSHAESGSTQQSKTAALQQNADWRAKPIFIGNLEATTSKAGFINQISSFSLDLEPPTEPTSFVVGTKWAKQGAFSINHQPIFEKGVRADELEKRLLNNVPIAARYLNTLKGNTPCSELESGAQAWRFKDHVHGLWTWSKGSKTYWLAQMLCYWKGALSTRTYLFVRNGRDPATVVDLFNPLTQSLGDVTNETLTRVRPYLMGDWLLLGSAGGSAIALVDLERPDNISYLPDLRSSSAMKQIYLSKDRRFVVQLNGDGNFYVYDAKSASAWNSSKLREQGDDPSSDVKFPQAKLMVSGRWIDDEILLYSEQGYYWGSYEAAQFVHLRQPGESGLHSIAQFAKLLSRPDIIRAAIDGKSPPEAPTLNAPPQLTFKVNRVAEKTIELFIEARSSSQLKFVRLFADGRPLTEISSDGDNMSASVSVAIPDRIYWLTGVAVDQRGLESTPFQVKIDRDGAPTGRLVGMVVGVDNYIEPHLKLNYASLDARRMKKSLEENSRLEYSDVKITELLNGDASGETIVSELTRIAHDASKDDTLLFFFSGHGFKDEAGHYRLTPKEFLSTELSKTGLEWSRIGSVLRASKGRVVVILDACHSGQSGADEAANDQVRDALSEVKAPMIILSAAKGRQFAYEDIPNQSTKFGGGAFTFALTNLLGPGRAAADKNNNGSLEVSEIYSALKDTVVKETANHWRGVQTPWLEQRNVVGDFVLF